VHEPFLEREPLDEHRPLAKPDWESAEGLDVGDAGHLDLSCGHGHRHFAQSRYLETPAPVDPGHVPNVDHGSPPP